MRIKAGLVLGVMLALGLAGCGGNNGIVTKGGSGSNEAALKFAQCMRENGIPNFPDPEVDDSGHLHIDLPNGVPDSVVKAAQEKCEKYLPGTPPGSDPQQVENMRKYSQCMRENGIPNWPDPEEDGRIMVDLHKLGLSGEDDPKLKAAEEKCRPLQAAAPAGGVQEGKG